MTHKLSIAFLFFILIINSCTYSEKKETYEETVTIESNDDVPSKTGYKKFSRSGYSLMIPKYLIEIDEDTDTDAKLVSKEYGYQIVISVLDSIAYHETTWAKNFHDTTKIGLSNFHLMMYDIFTNYGELKPLNNEIKNFKNNINEIKSFQSAFKADYDNKNFRCDIFSYQGKETFYSMIIMADMGKLTDSSFNDLKKIIASFKLNK